jgi:hypothetical protein
MAMPHDDFMDGPRTAVFRRKLALFNRAIDVEVLTLLESERDVGKIAIEGQVVPIGVLLPLLVAVLITVALAEPDIGYRRSGWQMPDCGLLGKITGYCDSIHLHGVVYAPFPSSSSSTKLRSA